jgi:hypothetical protein
MKTPVRLPDTARVVVYARTRWTVTLVFAVLGALAVVRTHSTTSGVVLAALALVPIVVVHRMRLRADIQGVTVVNLGRATRIPWPEISDFQMGRVGLSTCLDVRKRDGTRSRSWVVTTTGAAAYSRDRVGAILADLRERLKLATGESQQDLDNRAIEDALVAADHGDPSQASALIAEGRVDPAAMAEKLVERSQGRRETGDPAG